MKYVNITPKPAPLDEVLDKESQYSYGVAFETILAEHAQSMYWVIKSIVENKTITQSQLDQLQYMIYSIEY